VTRIIFIRAARALKQRLLGRVAEFQQLVARAPNQNMGELERVDRARRLVIKSMYDPVTEEIQERQMDEAAI
jgi:hypothetical protein